MPGRNGHAKTFIGFIAALVAVATVTVVGLVLREHVNSTTVVLVYVAVVVIIATVFESPAAMAASVLAALLFNYTFLPPYYQLTVADPENWVALVSFSCGCGDGRPACGPCQPSGRRSRTSL